MRKPKGFRIWAAGGLAAAALGIAAPPGGAADVCTWGGTAAQPTGGFSISPGLSNQQPAAGPLQFSAWGDLAGVGARCTGTLTIHGEALPGSQCRLFMLHGTVSGVPGLAWFFDVGGAYSRALFYGPDGRVAGSYGAGVIHEHFVDLVQGCLTPEGITGGDFWATVELI